MSEMLTLLSLNVRGLTKTTNSITWCLKKNADTVFLQETYLKMETEVQWRNDRGANVIIIVPWKL